mgnify:CR=1 FL=1
MISITDDDIGKEGRFTWCGEPCIVLRKLRGWKSPNFAIAYVDNSGSECALAVRLGDDRLVRIPAPPRKLYIGVRKCGRGGVHDTTCTYPTRELAEISIIDATGDATGDELAAFTIIEIPHPEGAP